MGMIQEFKEFAVKGNAMDLAVGVIIGGAFGKIVDSIVGDLIMPLVSRIVGKLEAWNPTDSNKDRAALGMIRHAERSAFLRPGATVVACSAPCQT